MTRIQNAWFVTASSDIGILVFAPLHARHLPKSQALLVTWLSLVTIQLLLIVPMKLRLKKENISLSKSFYWGAGVLMLLAGFIASAVVAHVAQPNSYDDLADSTVPLSDIQPEQKQLVIELLRKDIAATRANNEVLKNVKPIDPGVNTAESFASIATMQNTIQKLQPFIDEDKQYAEELSQAEDEFRKKMAAFDPAYLRDWDAKRKPDVDAKAEALRLETAWWASAQDLYSYAELHAKEIIIQNGNIGIHDETVRSIFNEKLELSRKLNDAMQKQVQVETDIKKQAQGR